MNRAHELGRAIETRKRIQALTHQVFKNALENSVIEESPVKSLKKMNNSNNTDKGLPIILSEKEEEAFIEAIANLNQIEL